MDKPLTPGMVRALSLVRDGKWRQADMSSVKGLERRGLVRFAWAPCRPRGGILTIVDVTEVK